MSTAAEDDPDIEAAAPPPPIVIPASKIEILPPEGEPPSKKKKGSSPLATFIKVAVAFGLMAWLYKSGAFDVSKVAAAVSSPAWLAKAVSVCFASIAIITIRWWLLLRLERIELPLMDALKLTLVGQFWNSVLPGAVTGDVVKMYYIGQKSPEKKAEAYATVMIDRVIGLAALVYLALFAACANLEFVFAPGHDALKLTFYGNVFIAACFTVGILALVLGIGRKSGFAERIRVSGFPFIESFRRGYRTLTRLGERPAILIASFALGVLSHALLVLVGIISGHALGESALAVSTYGFLVPVGLLVNSIPIGLPGGLGAGEKAFQTLFIWAGGAATLGANMMVLLRFGQLIWAAVGGVIYFFDRKALAPRDS